MAKIKFYSATGEIQLRLQFEILKDEEAYFAELTVTEWVLQAINEKIRKIDREGLPEKQTEVRLKALEEQIETIKKRVLQYLVCLNYS